MVDFGYIYETNSGTKEIFPGITVESRGGRREQTFLKGRKTDREVLYPEYCSWDEFDEWCDTIRRNFSELSNDDIYLAMIQRGQEPIEWLSRVSDETKAELVKIVTPFNNTYLDIEAILYWERNKCENICSLVEIINYYGYI